MNLTRRDIEHIQIWAEIIECNMQWTKADAKLFLKLEQLKKEINHDTYLMRKNGFK